MNGSVFISYRREDAPSSARLIYDRLLAKLDRAQVFIDVDNIDLGLDFTEVIGNRVGSCDALVAVIGRKWLEITDERGDRRLDDPEDFVRIEVEAALRREVRVIPVLVEGARMPRAEELPEAIRSLVRRNALELSHVSFDADIGRLTGTLRELLGRKTLGRVTPEQKEAEPRSRTSEPASRRVNGGAPSNFAASIKHVVTHCVVFAGRASRAEFWWWALFGFFVVVVAQSLDASMRSILNPPVRDALYASPNNGRSDGTVGIFGVFAFLFLILPSVSVCTRRLHDINRSGWWQLLWVSGIGIVPLIIWLCTPGDDAPNDHGPSPVAGRAGIAPE